MAEPEYPVLRELETKLKLQWIDTNDYLATQRAIIEVTPDHAYLELPRGRKGDKGDPGNAISFQGIVARTSDLPTGLGAADAAKAWVNTATKALHVWNGDQWFTVDNFAGVEADVQQFSRWFAQAADAARTALEAAQRAEYWANETIQQVTGDFATQNYVDERTWARAFIPNTVSSLDDISDGIHFLTYENVATALKIPAYPSVLSKFTAGNYGYVLVVSWTDPTRSWVAVKGTNGWSEWRDSSGRTQRLDAAWTSLDDVPEGVYFADNVSLSNSLGLPVTHGLLRVNRGSGAYGMATMTPWHDPTDEWVSERGGSGWGTWRKRDWGVTEQLRDEWTALDQVPDGVFFVDSTDEQTRLGLPAAHGTLEVRTAKPYGLATFKGWSEAGRTWVSERQTIGWRDWKPERLKLVDTDKNTRNVIEVDHYGTGYGLDIQNYPGADAAVVLHNYTGDGEAVIIDNCDNQPAVSIYNTINTGITPNNIAKGDFIQFSPWSDVQRKVWKARLTNDLTLKNDTEHPLSLQRVDEVLVGSRTQDDIVLQIKDKAGAVTASIYSDGRVSDRYTRQGEGMPEGKVSAPVGAIYTDTVATNGVIRWVKASGTGNTGWRVEYGDTGVRDITSLVPNLSRGAVRIRRVGLVTYMYLDYVEASSGTTPTFTIPSGWIPLVTMSYPLTDADGLVAGQLYHRNRSVELRLTGTIAGMITMPWMTSADAWPVSQIGTPY